MSQAFIARLADRGVVSVTGPDAAKLLQGLVTNDVAHLPAGQAAHAALLSAQGKILFDFIAVRSTDGYLLDVARDKAADLVKRLTMYKLRANVTIKDASDEYAVLALWGDNHASSGETSGTVSFIDPRASALGRRILAETAFAADIASATNGSDTDAAAYHAHRIEVGVPEGGKDYDFGDAYPHEANFDLFNGVSFAKGCYVGQEIVARMQHKTVVRKRVVRVTGDRKLPSDRPEILAGDVVIGKLGSVSVAHGLALLRLDRAEEFAAKGTPLTAGGVPIRLSQPAGGPIRS
ncbi:MAG: folate-binding protein [Hyphomicrobium sp.]